MRTALVLACSTIVVGCASPQPRAATGAPPPPTPDPVPVAPAATPNEPTLPSVDDAACVFRGSDTLYPNLPLRMMGSAFAGGAGLPGEIALRPGRTGGLARLSSEALSLVGEVELDDLRLVPRSETLRDGWLAVTGLRPLEVKDGSVVARPKPPTFVESASPLELEIPCSDLGLERTFPTPAKLESKLVPGKTSDARANVGGHVVAKVTVPANTNPNAESLRVGVLDQKGRSTKIRLFGEESYAELWLDAAAITKPAQPLVAGGETPLLAELLLTETRSGGGSALTSGKDGRRSVRCGREVSIHVRKASNELIRVGAFRPGATISAYEAKADGNYVPVDLGAQHTRHRDRVTDALVPRGALQDCTPVDSKGSSSF